MSRLAALTAIILLACCAQVRAQSLYAGAWSDHLNPNSEATNETHYLLGYEQRGYLLGLLVNSFEDPTLMFGKGFDLMDNRLLRARVYLGGTYGYYECYKGPRGQGTAIEDRSLCPAVVPEISAQFLPGNPSVSLLGDAVALTFRFDI